MYNAQISAVSIPADPHVNLEKVLCNNKIYDILYHEAVGSLLFVSFVSRGLILIYAIGLVRYLERHGKLYWQVVKRIFCYLKRIKNRDNVHNVQSGNRIELLGFSDSDHASDKDIRRSTTGYIFELTYHVKILLV